ncbi:Oligopeptide ABC superfamily ATP binding cassette transporter, binding protein [Lactiplantibacillus plantarum subsp. plantarum]|nr:Oligopeptide ABC superfamily ATP binding cassette transporter, binding protein [Lactiplantibacillus plantarum subsp. plantarum]
MKWKVMLTTATAAASTGLLLAACSQGQSKSDNAGNLRAGMAQKQVLNWSENGSELTTLDTSLVTDSISANMINNTMEGLYRIGNNNKITPGIATHTVISKDKKLIRSHCAKTPSGATAIP